MTERNIDFTKGAITRKGLIAYFAEQYAWWSKAARALAATGDMEAAGEAGVKANLLKWVIRAILWHELD